jgi:hypothetical protein
MFHVNGRIFQRMERLLRSSSIRIHEGNIKDVTIELLWDMEEQKGRKGELKRDGVSLRRKTSKFVTMIGSKCDGWPKFSMNWTHIGCKMIRRVKYNS